MNIGERSHTARPTDAAVKQTTDTPTALRGLPRTTRHIESRIGTDEAAPRAQMGGTNREARR
jgi:hypothetical protein